MKKLLLFFLIFTLLFPASIFSQSSDNTTDTAEEYTWEEFPQWAHDLRRTEVITLGSLPFTTLWTILIYGGYQYSKGNTNSFPNPFSSSATYTESEIKKILAYSFAASGAIGLSDFLFNLIKRKNMERKLNRLKQSENTVTINPLTPEEAGDLLRKNQEEKE